MPTADRRPVVSVQRPGVDDPPQAHLGPGLLIAPTKVLVHGDLVPLLPRRVEVVIAATTPHSAPIEHRTATPFPDGRPTVLRVDQHAKVTVGVLQLDAPSAHPFVKPHWTALRKSLGRVKPHPDWGLLGPAIPSAIRSLPDEEWLESVRLDVDDLLDLGVRFEFMVAWICRIVPWCDPNGSVNDLAVPDVRPGDQLQS